ncbi:MAG: (2Fe-2S)-binding protein [Pseudomonadota bacterium]
MVELTVNGRRVRADGRENERLLFFLRDELGLTGSKYGCGAAMCGACTVHVDGAAAFACQTYLGDLDGAEVTTIEGLSPDGDHPLQRAWVAEQVPQCGYCQSGQIMRAADLLARNPSPSRAEIKEHMSANLCRCGTYARITRAVERAAKEA